MLPAKRLLLLIALLTPLGLIPAMAPRLNGLATTIVLLAIVVALLDVIRAQHLLTALGMTLPAVLRMTHNRPSSIDITLSGQTPATNITLGLDLPASLSSEKESYTVPPPTVAQSCTIAWPITPQTRGKFAIEQAIVAGNSPMGLWEIRRTIPLTCEVRVYPDLFTERRNLAALFLNSNRSGNRVRRQAGQGREFEKIRDYIPGDSMDQIHWKATAKRNAPMSKVYQVERTQEIYVIIDSSRLSGVKVVDSQGYAESQLELFMKSTLVTGLVAQKQGDLFGLCTFSNKVDHFLRAQGGKDHYNSCRDQLFMLEPKPVSPDFRELTTFLRLQIRKRALLIILTNLDDPVLAEEFIAGMELINRQHLVLVMAINPSSATTLFSGDTIQNIDDIYRDLAGHMQDKALQTLAIQLKRHGVHLYRPHPEQLSLQIAEHYMSHKDRL
jgi:uncharacterized protein (DUF58 family)